MRIKRRKKILTNTGRLNFVFFCFTYNKNLHKWETFFENWCAFPSIFVALFSDPESATKLIDTITSIFHFKLWNDVIYIIFLHHWNNGFFPSEARSSSFRRSGIGLDEKKVDKKKDTMTTTGPTPPHFLCNF